MPDAPVRRGRVVTPDRATALVAAWRLAMREYETERERRSRMVTLRDIMHRDADSPDYVEAVNEHARAVQRTDLAAATFLTDLFDHDVP